MLPILEETHISTFRQNCEVMEMNSDYKVFVKTDEYGNIVAVNSSDFVSEDWGIEIDCGIGDRYHHAQSNYFDHPIHTVDGLPRYKLVEGKPVERIEQELNTDRLPNAKTEKIKKSKSDLEAYLLSHPLQWTDGETYSITEDKQNQLMGTLMAAQLDGKKPEWNTSGGVCREWELAMYEATSLAQLEEIEVDYDTVE